QALYGRRFILLVRDGIKLPSNLQDFTRSVTKETSLTAMRRSSSSWQSTTSRTIRFLRLAATSKLQDGCRLKLATENFDGVPAEEGQREGFVQSKQRQAECAKWRCRRRTREEQSL